MAETRHREEVVNVVCAANLAAFGILASPETISKIKKTKVLASGTQKASGGGHSLPDVVFVFRGLRCVLEGKYADVKDAKKIVTAQALERVESGLAQISVALVYPATLRTTPFDKLPARLAASEVEFALATESGLTDWRVGGLASILDELRRAQETLAKDDAVHIIASELAAQLSGIADLFLLQPAVCDRLSSLLGIDRFKSETQEDSHRRRETSAKIAALTIANAYIFQEQLSVADERVRTIQKLLSAKDLMKTTREHWSWIVTNINYVPIFKIAAEVLENLPSTGPANGAVKVLAEQGLSICSNKAALRHDLMGRIYHWLLHEAKFLGTYYTSVPAATLLLKLALDPIRWPGIDFGDFESLSTLRIADPACGTGTLLMASSQALTDNFVRTRANKNKKIDDKALRNLHQTLMENVLHGYDVLTSAIHLTASTLALLAPEISFRKMHLYTMPMGASQTGQIRLGSLDFISGEKLLIQFTLEGIADSPAEAVTGKGSVQSQAPLPKLDLCVMNPPFTRSVNSNLLFGSVPDARGDMQKELKRVVAKTGVAASITAGLGSIFVALADRYINEGGRIALVLPAALTTGDAWAKTRELIKTRYHLETVVSSHDPSRWAFSENTDLSEVLVIAQRRDKPVPNERTLFLNMWLNPKSSGESLAVAHAVSALTNLAGVGTESKPDHEVSSIRVGGRKYGEAICTDTSATAAHWLGGALAQSEALRAAIWLSRARIYLPSNNRLTTIPITKLGEIAVFGPDGRDIHDGYELSESVTSYPTLWGTDGDRIRTIEQQPNKWLVPRSVAAQDRKMRDVGKLWPRAARLMLSTRLRLNTQRLFAVSLPEPALSNIWAPTSLNSPSAEADAALAVWLNSSLGLLALLLIRVPTQGSWIQFKKPNLAEMPVLDLAALTATSKKGLVEAHSLLKAAEFLPYAQIGIDPARAQLDQAVAHSLGIPDLTPIRKLLSREPVVTGLPLSESAQKAEAEGATDQLLLFG